VPSQVPAPARASPWRRLFYPHAPSSIASRASEVRGTLVSGLASGRIEISIFTVGNELVSPFRMNPFEVLKGVSVSEHISALNACFSGAFSLWDPLPMVLDEAVRSIYADKGWSEYGVGGDDPSLGPPTMEDLYHKALLIAESKSYRGEVAGNIRGAIETRLGALIRGAKGRCFNARRSVPADILMHLRATSFRIAGVIRRA